MKKLVQAKTTQKVYPFLCHLIYRQLHFSYKERHAIRKNQLFFLTACHCSRLCMHFMIVSGEYMSDFWPK